MRLFNYDLIILIVYNLFENNKFKRRIHDYIYMLFKKKHLTINNKN